MRASWRTYFLAGFVCVMVAFAFSLADVHGVLLVVRAILDLLAVTLLVLAYRGWRRREIR